MKASLLAGVLLTGLGTIAGAQTGRTPLADCTQATSACVDKVDPPDWWVDLPSPMLLLHGTHLRGARIGIRGNGVKLEKTEVSTNGHYAFLWLVTDHAPTQTISIELRDGSENRSIPFTLAARRTQRPLGFSAADVLYLIFTDRFADGDAANDHYTGLASIDRSDSHAWHGGDFRGIDQHMDYLQQLGVTTVWITPAYENAGEPHAYHGYDATDLYAVDPHFGTVEQYRHLGDDLHQHGMKFVLDLVPNHVGPAHLWANDPPTPSWFHGTVAVHRRAKSTFLALVDPHATTADPLDVTDGWFSDAKPDLNQDDPLVEKYLIQNAVWWIEKGGLDGLRLDTFPYVQRTFWHDFHAELHEIYPHLTTVGEIYNHDPSITSFFAGGVKRQGVDSGLDTPFDFPVFSALRDTLVKGEPMTKLADALHQDKLYPHPERLVPFFGNHDTGRFLSEPGATVAEMKMGFGLLATLRGMPELYAGDEIAMRGGKDPDNRRDFPGGFPDDPKNAFTAEGRVAEQQDMFTTVSSLMHFRAEHTALHSGEQMQLEADSDTFVFLRAGDLQAGCHADAKEERLLVAVNRSERQRDVTLQVKKTALEGCSAFDAALGSADTATPAEGFVTLHLMPQTIAIFTAH